MERERENRPINQVTIFPFENERVKEGKLTESMS